MLENITLGMWVCLGALIIASLWDMRIREVPDWLNYALVAFGLGYALILSIFHQNYSFLLNSIFGLAAGFLVGLVMFYGGQWGGGDSKLVIGVCAILGLSIPAISSISDKQEVLVFFINTLLVGAVYGLIYSFVLAIIHFKKVRQAAKERFGTTKFIIIRTSLLALLILSIIYSIVTPGLLSMTALLLTGAAAAMFYIWALAYCIEKAYMIRESKVSDLTEGDWVVEPVVKGDKTILEPSRTGITLEELEVLKKNNIKTVTIKIGIPFVPSFLFAFIFTLAFGNWLLYII